MLAETVLVHGKYPGPGPTRSHQSGNHLTNRQSQPPPPVSSLLPPLPGWRRPSWTSETPPDVTRPRLEVAGGQNCHLIVKFDAKNSNFPSAAFYFPTWRGPGQADNSCRLLGWTGRLLIRAGSSSVLASSWAPTVKYKPVPLPGGGI